MNLGKRHSDLYHVASSKPITTELNASSPTVPASQPRSDLPMRSRAKTETHTSTRHSQKPLLQDASLYTNHHLPPADRSTTTLQELAHLVRLSKYQERRRTITRTRLERTLISTALSARMTRCGEISHRNLVDSFRKDDKDNFAPLYNAVQDVRKSCDELRRFALLEPDLEAQSSPILGSSESLDTAATASPATATLRHTPPFLSEISSSSRDAFLEFLAEIRSNPDYLATRICALSSSELNTLLASHRGLEPVESVLPFHSRSYARSHTPAAGRQGVNDVERLLSFQRHDPLSILIHTCFANSAGPDSGEDQRRTDIWATVLARLISEPKSTSEHFLICVLNSWTMMREWSGKSNMEWYLMRILSEGAFLLERAEDQHGTRFNLSDWTQSDEVAANQFYDDAVNQLFELVDDEDGTGIPEGLLELGNAVLKRLDKKYVDNTSKWLVWRCLFFVFLLGVIVHPESHGMLTEHHITPYAREKILKKVAMKAHEYVSGMWSGKQTTAPTVDIPFHIKSHIESILARFQGSKYKSPTARLLPARSVASLRETTEVHPYLVVSPADLSTLVNALFPERRPLSSASSTFRSGAASISGLSSVSQPISMSNPRNSLETASMVSTSVSSVFSEATSKEDHQDGSAKSGSIRYSPPVTDPETQRKLSKYEDDGYRLRLALHELNRNLGADVVRGASHPCAERWAVLFVKQDGKSLTTSMAFDEGDSDDEDTSSSENESDDADQRPELGRDYDQLRDSILKLVEEYEIPRDAAAEANQAHFSNRASRLSKHSSRRKRGNADASQPPAPTRETPQYSNGDGASDNEPPLLITMLKAAWSQAKAQSDFVSSHIYWKTLNQLRSISSTSLKQNGYAALINIFSREPRDCIRRSASAIEEYEAWLAWLKQSQDRLEGLIDRMMRRTRAIRDKMWYIADVRNSKEYEHSRDVCQALKIMATPHRWRSLQGSRNGNGKSNSSSYLYRTESQVVDILAAPKEQGGPNKLGDEQAGMTSAWLHQYGIENFCQGEERIHRFCCEVDKCISKLIGETIRDAPVLWSSELYKRDKLWYDRLKARERDPLWSGDDSSSIMSDNDRKHALPGSRPGLGRDLRTMSNQNMSQQSIDSMRHGFARQSVPLSEVLDNHETFDRSSPVYTADSISTFWSPFQSVMSPGSAMSRAYSPTTSMTNLSATFSSSPRYGTMHSHSSMSTGRPGTSASSSETVYQHSADENKTRFLTELRQSLTSLLLSDLGNQLLSRGSETDIWLNKLGQECIDRKEALELHAQRKSALREKPSRSSTRPRVIEKKKSFGNLRGAGESATERPSDTPEVTATPRGSGSLFASDDSHASAQKENESPEFPFKNAYKRLLTMFSVHPSPYAKLSALRELEQLIMASIPPSGKKRTKWPTADNEGSIRQERDGARRATLDGAIDSVQERRLQQSAPCGCLSANGGDCTAKSWKTSHGADVLTSELLKLLKDPTSRPKQLFRDLQLISSFVSPAILDKPERSKAFWNVGLAALKLKSEVCRTMVEMADEVFAAHTQSRNAAIDTTTSNGAVQSSTGTPPPPSTTYKLSDVGRMWAITAKEGYPTAQRELALFYLSNPEFVERTTLPLSKPREVFKQVVMDKYRRNEKGRNSSGGQGTTASAGSGGNTRNSSGSNAGAAENAGSGGKDNDVRNDPGLMCVAVHWMEAAEQGGDELATSFLRQNEFMGRV